jgi:hypothetical protein
VGFFRYWAVFLDDVDSFWAGRARAALNDKVRGTTRAGQGRVDVRGSTGWQPPHESSFVRRRRVAKSNKQLAGGRPSALGVIAFPTPGPGCQTKICFSLSLHFT